MRTKLPIIGMLLLIIGMIILFGCQSDEKYVDFCKTDADCPTGFSSDCPSGCIWTSYNMSKCINGICCNSIHHKPYEMFVKDCAVKVAYSGLEYCRQVLGDDYFDNYTYERCSDHFYEIKAAHTHNIEYCNEIKDYDKKRSCFSHQYWGESDVSICNKINDERIKNKCISHIFNRLAQKKNNSKYCGEIPEIDKKEKCYIELSKKLKDIGLCNEISSEKNNILCKSEAYISIAISEKNPDICKKILLNRTKDRCYLYLGKSLLNKDLCNNISSNFYRKKCLEFYYKKKGHG